MTFPKHSFIILSLLSMLSLSAEKIEGISKPSADILTSFELRGLIVEVNVKEGQLIKKGTLLSKLDDDTQHHQLNQQKKLSENNIQVDRATQEHKFMSKAVKHLEKAVAKGAATDKELDEAKLEQIRAKLDIDFAKFEKEQHRLKYHELKSELKKFYLHSPVEGTVESVLVETGETSDPQKEAFRIVRTNPLWIDAAVPVHIAKNLKKGSKEKILFPKSPNLPDSQLATVIYISSVADSASDTVTIRLEVNNDKGRLVGERVMIEFE